MGEATTCLFFCLYFVLKMIPMCGMCMPILLPRQMQPESLLPAKVMLTDAEQELYAHCGKCKQRVNQACFGISKENQTKTPNDWQALLCHPVSFYLLEKRL